MTTSKEIIENARQNLFDLIKHCLLTQKSKSGKATISLKGNEVYVGECHCHNDSWTEFISMVWIYRGNILYKATACNPQPIENLKLNVLADVAAACEKAISE